MNSLVTLFIVLIIIAAVLLVFLVLIQNSKGGGLAADFASGNQVMGAPKTADFLEKATWTLVGVIALCSVLAVCLKKNAPRDAEAAGESTVATQLQQTADDADAAQATPDFSE